MNEHVDRWFELACYDLESAAVLLNGDRYLHVGFMCQQAAEKALKGAIQRDLPDSERPVRIHNLLRLAEIAKLDTNLSDAQRVLLAQLNPLSVDSRYAEHKHQVSLGLDKEVCAKYVNDTEEFVCWTKKQL